VTVTVLVDGVRVPSYVIPTLVRPGAGYYAHERVVALRAPEGDPGPHTLQVIAGGKVWEADLELHARSWDEPQDRPRILEWLNSDRPAVLHPDDLHGTAWPGNLALVFPPGVQGLIIWEPGGALREISAGPRMDLRRDPPRPIGVVYSAWAHLGQHVRETLPVVVRAIHRDGSLGQAWYVDNDLRLAPEPEVEDGRFELLNPDDTVRWGFDAGP
jgi:hypothetical protein